MAVDLTPPESRLAELSEAAEAAALDPKRTMEAVEIRQHCLALAQLACRDDPLQLARASAELASAYLQAGSCSAAARHAAHADAMLQGAPAHATTLQAQAILTLACALAQRPEERLKAQEAFPRALSQCVRAYGPRSMELCPLLRSFARMLAAQPPPKSGNSGSSVGSGSCYARAEVLLSKEREIRVSHAAGGAGGEWPVEAREAITKLDQERAVLLLRHAKALDARAADAKVAGQPPATGRGASARGAASGGKDSYAMGPGFVQKPPQRRGQPSAGFAPPTSKPVPGSRPSRAVAGLAPKPVAGGMGVAVKVARGGGALEAALVAAVTGGDPPIEAGASSADLSARATKRRVQATELLGRIGGEGGAEAEAADGSASSLEEAELAIQLAEAHRELGQWEAAEASYLRALPAVEEARGCSDGRVLDLWTEVVALRMKTCRYELAAADSEHVLNMLSLTRGPSSAELIPAAERLAKAHVLGRRWPAARDALATAHTISAGRYGVDHRDTLRIADVLRSLEKYAPPRL